MALKDYFVSTEWLENHLEDEQIRIVDATVIFNPMAEDPADVLRSGLAGYKEAHIPGAIHADLFQLNQADADVPFSFSDRQSFAQAIQSIGLGEPGTDIIIYDRLSMVGSDDKCQFWASRLAWQLAQIGIDQVRILDGGFHKWQNEGRPIATGIETLDSLASLSIASKDLAADLDQVKAAIDQDDVVIIDTLPPQQYAGQLNPFGDDKAGHVPSAINIYYGSLTDNQSGALKSEEELKGFFDAAGLLKDYRSAITYCGFGVGATWVQYILNALGQDQVKVYDGSMTEWTQKDQPLVK